MLLTCPSCGMPAEILSIYVIGSRKKRRIVTTVKCVKGHICDVETG